MVNTKLVASIVVILVASGAVSGVYIGSQSAVPETTSTPSPTLAPTEPPQVAGDIIMLQPTINVTYSGSELDSESKIYTQYNFDITVSDGSLFFKSQIVNQLVASLADKYGLVTVQYDVLTSRWAATQIVDGRGTFCLFRDGQLTSEQLSGLCVDLQSAFMQIVT